MRNCFSNVAAALTLVCLTGIAGAQTPPPAAAPVSNVVASPTYISIPLEINVNRPAAEVWKRVGKYCDIGEWLRTPCTILSGKDGEIGTVRSIGGEILVGKTELSYTYTQPVRAGRPYILYHGTLEARPLTATTCKLVYTLMYDNSTLADDAARERLAGLDHGSLVLSGLDQNGAATGGNAGGDVGDAVTDDKTAT